MRPIHGKLSRRPRSPVGYSAARETLNLEDQDRNLAGEQQEPPGQSASDLGVLSCRDRFANGLANKRPRPVPRRRGRQSSTVCRLDPRGTNPGAQAYAPRAHRRNLAPPSSGHCLSPDEFVMRARLSHRFPRQRISCQRPTPDGSGPRTCIPRVATRAPPTGVRQVLKPAGLVTGSTRRQRADCGCPSGAVGAGMPAFDAPPGLAVIGGPWLLSCRLRCRR